MAFIRLDMLYLICTRYMMDGPPSSSSTSTRMTDMRRGDVRQCRPFVGYTFFYNIELYFVSSLSLYDFAVRLPHGPGIIGIVFSSASFGHADVSLEVFVKLSHLLLVDQLARHLLPRR